MKTTIPLILLAIAAGLPSVGRVETLSLSCGGVGSRVRSAASFGTATAPNGATLSTSGTTYYREESPDRVTVEITGDSGRIRVPVTIIPPLNAGGNDGWWMLDNVVVGQTEITARFSLNFLNKPRIRIDRSVGEIIISGLGRSGFRGTCEAFNSDPAARRF